MGVLMVSPKAIRHARDWRITTQDIASVGAIAGASWKSFHFYSPALQYACDFYVVEASLGAQIGISGLDRNGNAASNTYEAVRQAEEIAGRQSTQVINRAARRVSGGNSNWRIYRSFAANDMRGGLIGRGSIGATTGIFSGEGEKFVLFDNNQNAIAQYEGGSAGLALGFNINIGTISGGVVFNLHHEWTGHR